MKNVCLKNESEGVKTFSCLSSKITKSFNFLSTRNFGFPGIFIGSIALLLPVSGLKAFTEGEGTVDNPFVVTTNDVTLDYGDCYYLANTSVDFGSSTFCVGNKSTGNYLTITGSSTTISDNIGIIGYSGSGEVTVTNNSSWVNSGRLYVGDYEGEGTGTLIIQNGGHVSNAGGGIGKGILDGVHYTSTGYVIVIGSGSKWINTGDTFYIGSTGTGTLEINNDGYVTTDTCLVGGITSSWGLYAGGNGKVKITGSGSTWVNAGDLTLGGYKSSDLFSSSCSGPGTLTIDNEGLAVITGTLTVNDTVGVIYLSDGHLALYGKTTAAIVVKNYKIKVYDGNSWSTASASNLTAIYYDGTTNVWSASSLYATYGSKVDLTGYTVITGGTAYLKWADFSYTSDGWYDSSWYGWFYTDITTWGNWIYQEDHGWQYVYGSDDGTAYIWDNATQDWWFTSSTYYPYIYDYSTSSWYYYQSGTTPNRVFWSYSANGKVNESSL
jgi:T5SS/PEP-CTERM-associated repeat protein